MAKAQVIREIDVDTGQFVDPDEPQKTSADEALEDFIDKSRAAGTTAKITVKKLLGGVNSAESFCTTFPVDKYDYFELLEIIQTTWGPGDYRLYCTVKGRKGLLQNEFVSIAPAARASLNAPQSTSSGDIMQQMLAAMQESNQRLLDALKPAEGASGGRREMLQDLLLMKQVIGGETQQKSTLSQMKEMVEIFALMQGFGGGESKETGLADIAVKALENLGPVAAALISRGNNIPSTPPPARRPPPPEMAGRTVDAKPETAPKKEAHPMQEHADKIKQLCGLLAFTKPDPAEIAAKIAESLDENQAEQIGEWLQGADTYDELVKLVPDVAKHKEWFTDLIDHLKAMAGLGGRFADLYTDEESEQETGSDAKSDHVADGGNT